MENLHNLRNSTQAVDQQLINDLKQQLELKDQLIKGLNNQIQMLKSDLAKSEKRASDTSDLDYLKNELKRLLELTDGHMRQIEGLKKENEALQGKLSSKDKSSADIKAEYEKLQKKYESLELIVIL